METGTTNKGHFCPGTTKRVTLNMYDTASSTFFPQPSGPYEEQTIRAGGQPAAQDHFNATREIKLKDKHGHAMAPSTYKDHYPWRDPLKQEALPGQIGAPPPFSARSEYDDQYWNKPRMNRPVEPMTYPHRPGPWLTNETTNQATYKDFGPHGAGTIRPDVQHRPATQAPMQVPTTWQTTYNHEYTPKEADGRPAVGDLEPRAYPPWLANLTTYQDHYIPKELGLQPVNTDQHGNPYPFLGLTEYKDEYVPKDNYPVMPPLTGYARSGLQLPVPRRSMGVEYWHKGQSNQYYVLIPATSIVPCRARQVFTTLHDNQDQATILILYGEDPVASNNMLLGQFDLVNIPPAPKDVPRIEVTFHLDKESYLTVTARDLDTERQKLWQQRGEIIIFSKAGGEPAQ